MARPGNNRTAPKAGRPDADDAADARDDGEKPSAFQLWFEEAWEGWIRPVGLIVLLAVAFLLYKFDLMPERAGGVLCVLAVLGGTLVTALPPALPLLKKPITKAMFGVMLLAFAVGIVVPSLRAALPGSVVGEARLKPDQLSTTVHLDSAGPYDVDVIGAFKSATGEAEATYTVTLSDGSAKADVSGSLRRSIARLRTSRRGGTSTSIAERNEEMHHVPTIVGQDLTIRTEGLDDQLDGALVLQFRRAPFPVHYFWTLGALAVLLGLLLDTILTDGKTRARAYLAAGMGVCLVFSIRFPQEATPHSLVRPAVSELLLALAVGGLGGWLLSAFTRLVFGPKLPKKVRKKKSFQTTSDD